MNGGDVLHIGRTDFRNDRRIFGIKDDRFSHLYVIGKKRASDHPAVGISVPSKKPS